MSTDKVADTGRNLQSGQNDIKCVPYNYIVQNRIITIGLSAETLRINGTAQNPGGFIQRVRPAAFTSTPGANRGELTGAGAVYTELFPSKCAGCIITRIPAYNPLNPTDPVTGHVNNGPSTVCTPNPNFGINQQLLAKKNYMLQNNKNNVISGAPAKMPTPPYSASGTPLWFVPRSSGGFGGGLTKAQIWSRVARGRSPLGLPAKRYGLQNTAVTTPNQFNQACYLSNVTFGCGATTFGNRIIPYGQECGPTELVFSFSL